MMHVSRLAEEIVLWMSQNFGFIDLADRYCTGSSIMPQKRNPDVAELARGKTGRVFGHLMGLLTLMKGQPLTYNKDNQEDKEPLFDTVDTLRDTLRIMAEMVAGIIVKPEAMARARAEGLRHGHRPGRLPGEEGPALPRRARSGGARRQGRHRAGLDLSELPLATLQGFHPAIADDVYAVLTLRGSLNARSLAAPRRRRCARRSRGTARLAEPGCRLRYVGGRRRRLAGLDPGCSSV